MGCGSPYLPPMLAAQRASLALALANPDPGTNPNPDADPLCSLLHLVRLEARVWAGVRQHSPRDGIVAREGFALLSADYAQAELRVVAHFSQDPALLAAFSPGPGPAPGPHRGPGAVAVAADHWGGDTLTLTADHGGGDIFRSIAAKWKRRSYASITDAERKAVKQLTYGIIYGSGHRRCVQDKGSGFGLCWKLRRVS